MPLGISFITFQAIGYLIEIWRENKQPEKNFGKFATYLLFFPKMLCGPIERAHNFIPQLYKKNEFNYEQVIGGLKKILFGLFMKLVIADRLAIYTNAVYAYPEYHSGISLLIGSIFFTIQLFTDFAGYTQIAIGSAQILGYKLMENFNAPFKAKSITEFWSRWHISLSNWLRDYVFLPITYSVARRMMKRKLFLKKVEYISYIFGVLITMTICGLWHGASWNFIMFGFLQGFFMTIELILRKKRKKAKKHIPSWLDSVGGIIITSILFWFTTIFFRANSISDVFLIMSKIINLSGPLFRGEWQQFSYCIFSIFLLLIITIIKSITSKKTYTLKSEFWFFHQIGYVVLILLILLFGVFDGGQFIYIQF